jgi:hypothetical protein
MLGSGVAVHFILWPVDWRKMPTRLIDAEGMGPRHCLGTTFCLRLARCYYSCTAHRNGAAVVGVAGSASGLPVQRGASHHLQWLAEEARRRSAWWNRAARTQMATVEELPSGRP